MGLRVRYKRTTRREQTQYAETTKKNKQYVIKQVNYYANTATARFSFHAITGARPSAVFEKTVLLKKTDKLTLAVGYGVNKTHVNDTTGSMSVIEIL